MSQQTKSFKNLEQNPLIHSIFHDLLALTTKFLESKLIKLESQSQQTSSDLKDINSKLLILTNELLVISSETIKKTNKNDNTYTLTNEIKQYFKKRGEKSVGRNNVLPYELNNSPERYRKQSPPHEDFTSNINNNNSSSLKNSSSYQDFKYMIESNEPNHSDRKKSPPILKENHYSKEIIEENIEIITPKNKSKTLPKNNNSNHKKPIYQYYVNSNNRKLNDLISDSQIRKNPDNNKDVRKKTGKNPDLIKKETFQQKLAKKYNVLSSKSIEKLLLNENINSNEDKKSLKSEEIIIRTESPRSNKDNNHNNDILKGKAVIVKGPKKESLSCDRFYEDKNKMKNGSNKFLNYYYFFDKNKETSTISEEN